MLIKQSKFRVMYSSKFARRCKPLLARFLGVDPNMCWHHWN